MAIQHACAEGTCLESDLIQLRHRLSDTAARAAEQELRVEEQRLRLRIAELEPRKLKQELPPPPILVSAVNAANDSRLQPTDGRYRAVAAALQLHHWHTLARNGSHTGDVIAMSALA